MAYREDINAPEMKKKVVTPVANPETGEPTPVDEMLKIRRQRVAEDMMKNEFGSGGGRDENLATTIVTKSLDKMSEAEKYYQDIAAKAEARADGMGAELSQAKEDLVRVQVEGIKEMMGKLGDTLKEIKTGTQPKDALTTVREAKQILEALQGERPEASAAPPPNPQGDLQTQLALLKLQFDNQLAIKRLDLEIARQNNEFEINKLRLREEHNDDVRRYQDNLSFREKGLNTISDLASGISAGIGREMEGTDQQGHVESTKVASKGQPAEPDTDYELTVKSFRCTGCGETLAIPPTGDEVTCPSCETTYAIGRKPVGA